MASPIPPASATIKEVPSGTPVASHILKPGSKGIGSLPPTVQWNSPFQLGANDEFDNITDEISDMTGSTSDKEKSTPSIEIDSKMTGSVEFSIDNQSPIAKKLERVMAEEAMGSRK